MIEFIYSQPPWLVAAAAVLLVLLLGGMGGMLVAEIEKRRAAASAAEAARWRAMPSPQPRVVTGRTVRLTCCASPDYPAGARYCIRCGKGVRHG